VLNLQVIAAHALNTFCGVPLKGASVIKQILLKVTRISQNRTQVFTRNNSEWYE